jgi:hypothetical protein
VSAKFTEADYMRALREDLVDESQVANLAQFIADVRVEQRQRDAEKCDELGDRYNVDSHGQRTCRELAKIIRSGA